MRLAILVLAAACSNKLPDTRYYQLAAPDRPPAGGTATIVLEPLETDAAYDDERIVYRTTPYRLDYYQYHRWSAAPGVLIGNYLEHAFERTGRFRAVVREPHPDAAVALTGRVVAIEEVDTSKTRWLGRIVLELSLRDARSGEVIWSEQFEETEAMPTQHPEGLARALSAAMGRIVARAAPTIADLADARTQLHASGAAASTRAIESRRRPSTSK